jgi:hypothetical protein
MSPSAASYPAKSLTLPTTWPRRAQFLTFLRTLPRVRLHLECFRVASGSLVYSNYRHALEQGHSKPRSAILTRYRWKRWATPPSVVRRHRKRFRIAPDDSPRGSFRRLKQRKLRIRTAMARWMFDRVFSIGAPNRRTFYDRAQIGGRECPTMS